jgi:energy-coupling factor transporter ATP-binding protein EcfA2
MSSVSSWEWPADLLPLLGDRVVLLHGPRRAEAGPGRDLGGRDLDCAVLRLDPLWPLRLGDGWRLCQSLHYDLGGWYWVVERQGRMLSLDTIDDPTGLGRDGFPTRLLGDAPAVAPDEVRAAYLAAKRLRKGMPAADEWARIGLLARANQEGFLEVLAAVVGRRLARPILQSALQGRAPDPGIWRRARRRQRFRRVRTPARTAAALTLGARRQLHRVAHPTGLFVLVVGPDGSGKSTLARNLPELCDEAFRRTLRYHWRPEFLPTPARLLGTGKPNPAQPHGRPSHSRAASLLLLGYYWLDMALGGWLRVWPFRMRTGLFVNERGWWDIAVDPRRYRLSVPPWLIRALGALLPHPDLALILDSSPQVLLQRKSETSEGELQRQLSVWRDGLPHRIRTVHLDASRPLGEVQQTARDTVLGLLEARATARLGAGWAAPPPGRSGRWLLPRAPRRTARAGLAVYQPVTTRGLLGWEAARLLSSFGGFRLLPRGAGPPREVRQALARHLPSRGTLAVARTTHPGRYIALLLDAAGTCRGVAKVSTDAEGGRALDREAAAIASLGRLLQPPVMPPTVVAHEPGMLLMEPVPWRPRLRPWWLDEEVARVLGGLFRAGAAGGAASAGPAHGDCAPWNLLWTGRGWVLIDWEDAAPDAPAFLDLFHYIVQAHAILERPSWRAVLDGVGDGRGWVGRAVRAYAEGAGLAVADAPGRLATYLRDVEERLLPLAPGEHDGTPARQRLLRRLGG